MTDLVAPITEVTVYANRALITRAGSIKLEAGEHELRVNDLSPFLQESLRASGKGPQGARILNVDITTAFHARPPESEIQTLQTECELLQQQIDLIRARQAALDDRRSWLRALGEQSHDFARGLARGQMKPQDCADFFGFAATQAQQNAEDALGLDTQLKQKADELGAKHRELAQKQGYSLPDRLAAVVSLEMPVEGEFTLELSYLVAQAWWRPQYDVRVAMDEDGNRGEVELTYTGLVQQSTGENWEQVSLALSTARPSQAAVLPELEPQYLQVVLPPPLPAPAAPAGMALLGEQARSIGHKTRTLKPRLAGGLDEETAPSLMNTFAYAQAAGTADLDLMPQTQSAGVATASVEQTGTAYVFRVGRSVDIPSDNSPHKTTIARDDLPCEFDYVSAPGIEQNVHLRARITNTTERVLLPGESSIFLSGEYVGTTKIKMTAPREQFKVFLGIDDTIKVKREQIERTVEKGALLQGDQRRTTYAYRITLHNYAAFPRHIVLRDQLPVSQHERIRVRNQSIQPAPTERTKLELLTWRLSLAADGEQKIDCRFTVEHPQDMQVTGLP
jgi:uncharacterized protein (TIGR02231 family)